MASFLRILMPYLLLFWLLYTNTYVKVVARSPGKELALLSSGAFWYIISIDMFLLLFMGELTLVSVAPALCMVATRDV